MLASDTNKCGCKCIIGVSLQQKVDKEQGKCLGRAGCWGQRLQTHQLDRWRSWQLSGFWRNRIMKQEGDLMMTLAARLVGLETGDVSRFCLQNRREGPKRYEEGMIRV